MSYRASIWPLQTFLALGCLFFLVMTCLSAYLSLMSGLSWGVAAGFCLFLLFEMMLVLNRGSVEIDEAGIGTTTAMGRYRMRWNDVTSMVIGKGDLWIIGVDRHLVLVAPAFWSGPGKEEARRVLKEKAAGVAQGKPLLILPWSKNCKIASRFSPN